MDPSLTLDAKVLALITAVTFGMSPVALKLAFKAGGKTDAGMVIGLVSAIPLNLALILFINPGWDRLTPVALAPRAPTFLAPTLVA